MDYTPRPMRPAQKAGIEYCYELLHKKLDKAMAAFLDEDYAESGMRLRIALPIASIELAICATNKCLVALAKERYKAAVELGQEEGTSYMKYGRRGKVNG